MPKEAGPAFLRHELPLLPVTAVTGVGDGTGALTLIDSLPLGYVGVLEKLRFVSSSIATGTSATQTYKLRKGGATGTVVATLTIALADVNGVGKFKVASVAAADDASARLMDTETLSLTRDASGTAYTKLEGLFSVVIRQKPQARV
jgi:hypothetical protein